MFQPPEDFDTNPFANRGKKQKEFNDFTAEELGDVSPEDFAQRKKELGKILIWLGVFGLGLGIIVVTIVAIAMTKLGLTKRPDELEPIRPRRPRQEQIDKTWLENLDGIQKR